MDLYNSTPQLSTVLPPMDSSGDIIFAVCLGLLSIFGAVGNCLTILAVIIDRKLRSHTANYFIVNLAVADLMVFTVIEPFLSFSTAMSRWPFSDTLCVTLAALVIKHLVVSDFIMASIAINRYVSIVRHRIYHKLFTPGRTLLVCLACWIPGIITIIIQVVPPYYAQFIPYYGTCVIVSLHSPVTTRALSILSGIIILFSILLSSLCYARIYWTIRQSKRRVRSNGPTGSGSANAPTDPTSDSAGSAATTQPVVNRNNRASKADVALSLNLFIVFAVFCVCWTPLAVVIILENAIVGGITLQSERPLPYWVWPAAYRLVLFNSTFNIFIYAWKNRNFRSAYSRILRCRKC
ncbi:melatonin receptor type 1B-like [Asterias amurensis]|uniref:melatonin receptor type 1B-like n=1 Tax=Asterias amurensis TaxID=7602 RepID=UPI003AB53947